MLLEASPRTGKTDFIKDLFLTRWLGLNESKRVLMVGSNKSLKNKLRRGIERIIKTDFYKRVFPGVKILYSNSENITMSNGNMIEFKTTKSAAPTGLGYHLILLIDFLPLVAMKSKVQMEFCLEQLSAFTTRTEHNPRTKIIVDNQRIGLKDLSHHLTTAYDKERLSYKRITLPYYFDEDRLYYLKHNNQAILFKKGEYLVARFNATERRAIIAQHGDYVYDTQYLQKPRQVKGALVNSRMFGYYSNEDLDRIEFISGFITTDTTMEDKAENDYTVYCFWLTDRLQNVYLIDMYRAKIKGIETNETLYIFYKKWKDGLGNGTAGCDYMYFENTVNTKHTIQSYQNGFYIGREKIIFGGTVRTLSRTKSKFSRFQESLPQVQQGKMHLPAQKTVIPGVADPYEEITKVAIKEYEGFREDMTHDHDDIVDNGTDAINIVRSNWIDFAVGM